MRVPLRRTPRRAAEIGVRPEDLKVEPWREGQRQVPARVFEVEPLGGYTVVTLDCGAGAAAGAAARPARHQAGCDGGAVLRRTSACIISCQAGSALAR